MEQETCQGVPDPELTDKQARLLEALMKSPTVASAAEKAGCSERSAYRWLASDPQFRAAYRQAKRSSVEQAMVLIGSGIAIATSTLVKICGDSAAPASARVAAAAKILDTAFRSLELDDLAGRLETLESRVTGGIPVNGHVDV